MTGDRAGGSFRHRPRSQSARSHRRRPVRPRPLRVSCPARTGVQPPGARAHPDRGGALRRLPEKRAGALSCDVSRTVARARQQAHPWRTPQPAQPDSRHSNGFESGANFPPPDRAHPRYADAQDATPNAVFPAEPGESRSSTACAGLRTTQRGAHPVTRADTHRVPALKRCRSPRRSSSAATSGRPPSPSRFVSVPLSSLSPGCGPAPDDQVAAVCRRS